MSRRRILSWQLWKLEGNLFPGRFSEWKSLFWLCLFKWKLECELKNGMLRLRSDAHSFGPRRALGAGKLVIDFWSMSTLFVSLWGMVNMGYEWKFMLIDGIFTQLLPWTPSPATSDISVGASEQFAFCRNLDKLIHSLWKHISTPLQNLHALLTPSGSVSDGYMKGFNEHNLQRWDLI